MLLLLLALQAVPSQSDTVPASIPRITLAEAVRRSSQFDPDYVRALGQIDNAEWGRRAAMLAFFIPSIDLGLDQTEYSESSRTFAIISRSSAVMSGLSLSGSLSMIIVSSSRVTKAFLRSVPASVNRIHASTTSLIFC